MRKISVLYLAAACVVFSMSASASDWSQWFGANHDGSSDEKLAPWPAAGPKVLWKIPMGEGLGTIVATKDKAYVMAETQGGPGEATAGGEESVVCLDVASGKRLWAAPVGKTILGETKGNDGPRSTPALDGDFVYAVGTYLNVACFNAKTGDKVWAHDLAAEFGGDEQLKTAGIGAWGCANSPVIDGNLLFVQGGGPGQAFIAFNKKDGSVGWKSEDDLLAHTTPTVATILGQRQVIFFSKKGLASLNTENGKVLWRYPFRWNVSTAISPVADGDIVYCGAGYGVGAGAVKISKDGDAFKATEIWKDAKMPSHWSTPVAKNGYMYGLIGFKEFGTEPLKCVELATGKVLWSQNGFGQGGTAYIDGKILIFGDRGQLVLCEASEKGYKELANFQAFKLADKVRAWNAPTVSNGKIFLRTSKEAMCLDTK